VAQKDRNFFISRGGKACLGVEIYKKSGRGMDKTPNVREDS
jgi:hypothetical protein